MRAYSSFLERAHVRNVLACGVGLPYSFRVGIPQGCLLSMTSVALLVRPWARSMGSLDTILGSVADDVMLVATGAEAGRVITRAVNGTFAFIRDAGGQLSDTKSRLFASTQGLRRWLACVAFDARGIRLKVVPHMRDLGPYFDTTRLR